MQEVHPSHMTSRPRDLQGAHEAAKAIHGPGFCESDTQVIPMAITCPLWRYCNTGETPVPYQLLTISFFYRWIWFYWRAVAAISAAGMDPLSLAANVIAVLGAAKIVIRGLESLKDIIFNTPEQLLQTLNEVCRIRPPSELVKMTKFLNEQFF